jgi:signal transduction histidine kinase
LHGGDLGRANETLSERNLDVDQYATAVAHDLRTPLYVVRAYAELLAEPTDSEEAVRIALHDLRAVTIAHPTPGTASTDRPVDAASIRLPGAYPRRTGTPARRREVT